MQFLGAISLFDDLPEVQLVQLFLFVHHLLQLPEREEFPFDILTQSLNLKS